MEVSGSYKVLYTKDGSKKRKIFHDGTLVIKRSVGSSCTTVLYDENIQELRKTTENNASKAYSVGDEFNFGAYMIQIEEVDGKTAITSTAVEGIENRNMNSNAMSRPQVQRFKAPQSITPIAQVPLPPASQSHPMIQEEQTNQFMQSFSPIPTKPSSTLSFKTGSVTASILQANRSNRSGLSYRSLHNNPNNNNTLPVTNNNNSIPLPPSSNYSYPTPVETTYPTFPLPVSMVKEEESSYCESSSSSFATTTNNNNTNTNPSTTPFIKPILKTTLISNNKPNTKPFQPPLPSLSSSTTNILSHHNNRKDIQLDNNLTKVMKEHQIIGANFILDCILRRSPPIIHADEDEDEEESEKRVRGCILADDMGLGKSLTTISVIWTLISLQITKVVIVCPSSLIDNWVQELKKWLGMKLIPLVIRSGSDANAIINTFAISRINKFPLLILSYEVSTHIYDSILYAMCDMM